MKNTPNKQSPESMMIVNEKSSLSLTLIIGLSLLIISFVASKDMSHVFLWKEKGIVLATGIEPRQFIIPLAIYVLLSWVGLTVYKNKGHLYTNVLCVYALFYIVYSLFTGYALTNEGLQVRTLFVTKQYSFDEVVNVNIKKENEEKKGYQMVFSTKDKSLFSFNHSEIEKVAMQEHFSVINKKLSLAKKEASQMNDVFRDEIKRDFGTRNLFIMEMDYFDCGCEFSRVTSRLISKVDR